MGSNPAKFEEWLRFGLEWSAAHPIQGQTSMVLVNAWNEWAEGAYLEPDMQFGSAYLNAVYRAVTQQKRVQNTGSQLLLVGHDAYRHGAQLLLLNIAREMVEGFGQRPLVALLQGGPLVEEYQKWADVVVLHGDLEKLAKVMADQKIQLALTNTVVTGGLVPWLQSRGVRVVSLIHELPALIKERNLEPQAASVLAEADQVLFASEFVREKFLALAGGDPRRVTSVLPQGIYQSLDYDPEKVAQIRVELGLAAHHKLVINMGYGDLRKGFDLFLATAREVIALRDDVHFLWLGGLEKGLKDWLSIDLEGDDLAQRVHILPFSDQVGDYLHASDAFFLSSREDPFPSVVLEALAAGLPVVAFAGCGGFADPMVARPDNGRLVKLSPSQAAQALIQVMDLDTLEGRQERGAWARTTYDWHEYIFHLLDRLHGGLRKVSVVVPNYNYERYLGERLESILRQTYPIYEILVLDDCSSDRSLALIDQISGDHRRRLKVVSNETNSGSVFRQWAKGASLAQGDYLWIAEADDSASEEFLAQVMGSMTDQTVLSFSDSRISNSNGEIVGESYGFYLTPEGLRVDGSVQSFGTSDFASRFLASKNTILNVSGVVFRRADLTRLFDRDLEQVLSFKVAGDWWVYAQLLRTEGEVVFVSKALNVHRRHGTSVTHALDAERHLAEIRAMQDLVHTEFRPPSEIVAKAHKYWIEIQAQLRAAVTEDTATK